MPQPYRVIFADDEPDTLHLLETIGRLRGWDVDSARSAEELLAKVEDAFKVVRVGVQPRGFDIVVTDVSFFGGASPGISGITAGRQLERAFPNLPILFLTGYNGLLTRENIKAISTADYLEKPVDSSCLVQRIEYLIGFTSAGRYGGPERRRTSINRTHYMRRVSDKRVGVPRVLKLVIGANI